MADTLSGEEKAKVLRSYAIRYPQIRMMVETGLWEGWGSSAALADLLPAIVIDAQETNVQQATWATLGYVGDSGERMPEVLEAIKCPCLFWLDAHWIEEYDGPRDRMCPLLDELAAIRAWPYAFQSVVLVDDARLLGTPGYPDAAAVLEAGDGWAAEQADDILRLTPR